MNERWCGSGRLSNVFVRERPLGKRQPKKNYQEPDWTNVGTDVCLLVFSILDA